MSRRFLCTVAVLLLANVFELGQHGASHAQVPLDEHTRRSSIGHEVSVPKHLQDGEEFTLPLAALLVHGKLLFDANWTEQEGGGRPLTKGTGRPLADPSQPLSGLAPSTACRRPTRTPAPDATTCRTASRAAAATS